MVRVLTIPVIPDTTKARKPRNDDPRYVEGQRILVEAIRYLTQTDMSTNRPAIELLSEHFRTKFRMTDVPVRPE